MGATEGSIDLNRKAWINNTGSNQALGVLMGYGHVKAHPALAG